MFNFSYLKLLFITPVMHLPAIAGFVVFIAVAVANNIDPFLAILGYLLILGIIEHFKLFGALSILGYAAFSIASDGDIINWMILGFVITLVLWNYYAQPWVAALEYITRQNDYYGNPVAMIWAVVKAYVGLGLYTFLFLVTPVLIGIQGLIETNSPGAPLAGGIIALLAIGQRRWILFKRQVLPWPEFDATDEDFQYLDSLNPPPPLPPARPFGI